MIELAGNGLPLTALSETYCVALERIRPFSLISSIRNHGIVPFIQYSFLAFDGVYPFLVLNNSEIVLYSTPSGQSFVIILSNLLMSPPQNLSFSTFQDIYQDHTIFLSAIQPHDTSLENPRQYI